MENLTIVGTSHISQESKQKIKQTFLTQKPDIICVELDRNRLQALLNGQSKINWRMIKHVGLTGFLFALIGRFIQKKLGKITGMNPGEDMLHAFNLAKNNDKRVALIDRDITITLRRLSNTVPFTEKAKLIWDILTAPFTSKFRIDVDIKKVPKDEVVQQLTNVIKQQYPQIYRVMIDERDHYMAKAIKKIRQENPDKNLMIVIGAGHKQGIETLLQNDE